MAKRFTDSEKFYNPWYRKLDLKHKVLWEYMISACNHAGILMVDIDMMSLYVGAKIKESDIYDVFEERIVEVDEDKIFIPKFIEFQYGAYSEKSKIHIAVMKTLSKYGLEWGDYEMSYKQKARRKRSRITKEYMARIYARDNFECVYCGSKNTLLLDHIVPISEGGNNESENLATCCKKCNTSKSTNSLDKWVEKLRERGDEKLDRVSNFLDRVSNELDTLMVKEKEKKKEKEKEKEEIKINEKFLPYLLDTELKTFFINKLKPSDEVQSKWLCKYAPSQIISKMEDLKLYVESKGKKYSNYSSALTNFLKKDIGQNNKKLIFNLEE